jgi:hypothetical protein
VIVKLKYHGPDPRQTFAYERMDQAGVKEEHREAVFKEIRGLRETQWRNIFQTLRRLKPEYFK